MKKLLLIALGCCSLISCETESEFEGNQAIRPDGWKATDAVHFEFETNDTIKLHNFYLDIRNREDYPYSNIFFFVEMEFPNGNKSIDTVECMLADAQGKWLGEPTANLFDHEFLYQRGKQFPLGGRYKIDIRHGMRNELLTGVTDIGFKLKHTQP
ncbi:MAG: gliding motility lipoprotein GldH [Flavobacteriales bacterium]